MTPGGEFPSGSESVSESESIGCRVYSAGGLDGWSVDVKSLLADAHVVLDSDPDSDPEPEWFKRTVRAGDTILPARKYPVYFVHADHLGSTLLVTCHLVGTACADGTVARRFRYNAYGQPAAYTASGQNANLTSALPGSDFVAEHLYTGQRWVSAAALYDYGARYYDPQLVQFVSQDPVREYVQAYAYVGWNPVRYTDPTGMYAVAEDLAITAAVVGGFTLALGLVYVGAPSFLALAAVGGVFGALGALAGGGDAKAIGVSFLAGFAGGAVVGFFATAITGTSIAGLALENAAAGGLGSVLGMIGASLMAGALPNTGDVIASLTLGTVMGGSGAGFGMGLAIVFAAGRYAPLAAALGAGAYGVATAAYLRSNNEPALPWAGGSLGSADHGGLGSLSVWAGSFTFEAFGDMFSGHGGVSPAPGLGSPGPPSTAGTAGGSGGTGHGDGSPRVRIEFEDAWGTAPTGLGF